ncbi:MAG TPA: type II secretion system F family protein [Candidatus Polarisedimenticolia bacterium]|nr:type II secretion system F family protein [Candidatus Polarisedimenticolia bacterium]
MTGNTGLAVMVFAGVACAVMLLGLLWEWFSERRRMKQITERLGDMGKGGARVPGGDPFGDLFREGAEKESSWLLPVVSRLPHGRDLQHLLDQADINWRVGTYLLVSIGVATAFGFVALIFTRIPYIAVAFAAFAATLPYMYVRRRKTKRLRAFEENFPESIDLLGRAIRAGHAFSTGLQLVAEEAPQPIGMEFRRVFEEQKFGLSLEDSLLALADRIELLDMRIFVTAVLIQREVGGNLAEILDKISYTIRERFTIERQVRVYTAQGRFTGYLLAALPFGVGFLIFMLNREYMTILWERPVGRLLMAVALVLQVIGFFIIRKIINIKI